MLAHQAVTELRKGETVGDIPGGAHLALLERTAASVTDRFTRSSMRACSTRSEPRAASGAPAATARARLASGYPFPRAAAGWRPADGDMVSP
jgi:hypothetical protein